MTAPRIASLLAGSTEILHGLGLDEHIVAVSHECDAPAELVAGKPRVTISHVNAAAASAEIDAEVRRMSAAGAALYGVDRDRLVRLRPDLIVTQAQCDVCAVSLEDVRSLVREEPLLASARIVAINPMALDDLFDDIRRIADAAGVPRRGRAYVAELESRVGAVAELAGSTPQDDRPRVCCIEWIDPIMVAANWVPELIELAGGCCTLTQKGEHTRYTKWEDLVAFDPEVILIAPCGFDLERARTEGASLTKRPDWTRMAAVRDDRVFAVDGNAYFNRTGPRLVDSLEILAGLIHPDRFARFRETYADAWCRFSQ